ncbi:MAG: AMP-binding protein [Acidimicrobiia bacterium]|nr:AMP-binding protein [Acidimicrobiia bacterium]
MEGKPISGANRPSGHENGLLSGDRWLAQAELQRRVGLAAGGFDALGVEPGQCVALMLRNDPVFVEVTLATATLGGIPTPVNWHWRDDEVSYLLGDCGARVLVIHADLLAEVADAVPAGVTTLVVDTPPELAEAYRVPADDAAAPAEATRYEDWLAAQAPYASPPRPSPGSMIYTSGTTGRPKGVERRSPSADQTAKQRWMLETVFGLVPGVRTVVPAPMYHSAPNAYAVTAAALGTFTVLMPRFDPTELLELIEAHQISHVQMVPTMFVRLLALPEEVRRRYDLSSLRFVVHAAAPCPAHVKREMIEWFGPVIWEYYGCTESGAVVLCSSDEWLAHPGTVGKALDGAVVKVYGDDGDELPPFASGEVFTRMVGGPDFTYRNDPAKRAGAGKGELITCGDIGYLDDDGYLYLNDRRNDMVISGGVNIYPAEIEAALVGMAGVADCAVFGIPDEEFGEALAAYIEPDGGATVSPDAVRAFVREHLAGYKVPRVVEIVDALPREDSGKIFKRRLRDPYWAGRDTRI